MNQISGTTPTDAPAQAQDESQPADAATAAEPSGFGSRGRARRRARFLRRARELAYRDLGGLVFNLHRFGQRNDALVLAKLTTLGQIDAQLRAIEAALEERGPVTVLREAGIAACPRCAAIHSSEDRFCPNCGLPMSRNVDLPIAGAATPSAGAQPLAGPSAGAQETTGAPGSAPSAPPVAQPPAPSASPSAPASASASASASATSVPVPAHPPTGTSGRAPNPPARGDSANFAPPAAGGGDGHGREESTEILRPGAHGP